MMKVPAVKNCFTQDCEEDWKHEDIVYGSKGQAHPHNSSWCMNTLCMKGRIRNSDTGSEGARFLSVSYMRPFRRFNCLLGRSSLC